MSDKSLDGAYAIETPDDSVKLYRSWAETYDSQFAAAHGYVMPRQIARIFADEGGAGPVLDIGAGTGLVAEALGGLGADGHGADGHGADGHGADGRDADGLGADGHGADGRDADGHGADRGAEADGTGAENLGAGELEVDAIDISQEMLDVAGAKGLYRQRFCADLTAPLDIPDASYAGLISAGTFTHGHVGPVCLPELMRIARPGALFVLSINAGVFDQAGFGSAFAGLVADGLITPVGFRRARFYEGADHDYMDDTGLVAIFHRC